jgi:SSS family solute:Na+ symporter
MFWKRTTGHAAFIGLLGGFLMALVHHGLTEPEGANTLFKGGWLGNIHTYPVEMAQNFWTAIIAFGVSTTLTVVISLLTEQKKSEAELRGLVYSLTPRELSDKHLPFHQRPVGLSIIVGVIFIVLTIIFW